MIANPEAYFSQFIPPRDEILMGLEEEAKREEIPIVGPVVGQLLYILCRASGARKVLELGCATGYSAIYLARACRLLEGCVITLEKDEGMAQRARANFAAAGLEDTIEVRVGDAAHLMAAMEEPFDLIFMDIDKEGYREALSHCHRLLREAGLLVTDNVGFQGADAFNRHLFSLKQWKTVHLLSFLPGHSPERDGLSLAVRIA
jgi:predicted O-methyltransferase YrrM